jgi:choline dehydrogenase-like flavoprotein
MVLQRDKDSIGSITLDSNGDPVKAIMTCTYVQVVHYALSKHDSQSLVEGTKRALDVAAVEGAKTVFTLLEDVPVLDLANVSSDNVLQDPTFIDYKRKIAESGYNPPRNSVLLSAHQMGSCRMASSPKQGACNPNGQLWTCPDVWVCDGSLFPTASGVNPMVTILAIADGVAQECAKYALLKRRSAKL